jgi:hypothetical protein
MRVSLQARAQSLACVHVIETRPSHSATQRAAGDVDLAAEFDPAARMDLFRLLEQAFDRDASVKS